MACWDKFWEYHECFRDKYCNFVHSLGIEITLVTTTWQLKHALRLLNFFVVLALNSYYVLGPLNYFDITLTSSSFVSSTEYYHGYQHFNLATDVESMFIATSFLFPFGICLCTDLSKQHQNRKIVVLDISTTQYDAKLSSLMYQPQILRPYLGL